MRIEWKSSTDRDEVVARIAKAGKRRRTLQRDRLRVVLLAGDGDEAGRELFREQIAARVGRSRQFVDQWAGRYRMGGIYDVLRRLDYSSLKPRPRHRKNDPVQAAQFEQQAPFLRRRSSELTPAGRYAGS